MIQEKNFQKIWWNKKNIVPLHRFSKVGAFSSAGLEHLPYKQRVGGSNPSTPTKKSREQIARLLSCLKPNSDSGSDNKLHCKYNRNGIVQNFCTENAKSVHKVYKAVAQRVQGRCTKCAEPLHKECKTVAQSVQNRSTFLRQGTLCANPLKGEVEGAVKSINNPNSLGHLGYNYYLCTLLQLIRISDK